MTAAPLFAAVAQLLEATNAFDVDAAVAHFAADATIEDPSVGQCFEGHQGIRSYLTQFFVGYRTRSQVIASEVLEANRIRVRVDCTGTFGHEIGILEVLFGPDGCIAHINADLV